MSWKWAAWFSAVLAVASFFGCGSQGNGRVGVSGKVTLKGAPLDSGTIDFVADDGTHQAGATVTAGEYKISAAQGLLPRVYIVRISSITGTAADPNQPPGPEAVEIEKTNQERIPADYNVNSLLRAKVQSGQPGVFNFDVP